MIDQACGDKKHVKFDKNFGLTIFMTKIEAWEFHEEVLEKDKSKHDKGKKKETIADNPDAAVQMTKDGKSLEHGQSIQQVPVKVITEEQNTLL
jgi:hypothetical protein